MSPRSLTYPQVTGRNSIETASACYTASGGNYLINPYRMCHVSKPYTIHLAFDSHNNQSLSPKGLLAYWCLEHRPNRRMVSSGMLRRVAVVRTDVSGEFSASFIRVTRIGELGTTLAVTSNRNTLRRNTKYPDEGGAKFLRNVCS
jgi:hypothetical protein